MERRQSAPHPTLIIRSGGLPMYIGGGVLVLIIIIIILVLVF